MTTPKTPVVFIHGLWLHATSWQSWIDAFAEAGYEATAPGWPGVPDTVAEARDHPEQQAGKGIADIVEHYAGIIGSAGQKPIVVGHSFGGLVAQSLLGQDLAAAAVAIDPAPMKGVVVLPPAELRAAFPVLRSPANRNQAVSLTAPQFRYAFGNAISERESAALYDAWTIPSPGRPLFEAAFANFTPGSHAKVNTRNSARGPLLLISGQRDHTVPDVVTHSTFKQYRHSTAITDLRRFADRGHSLTIDSGWREIADAALGWLSAHKL
ncbi:MAG TPA: alpha/beta hydrolase [Streptosporangiaceae bacterium]|nr:alpha/beta hydrolase [Streptosporangiaceae bacterium]